MSNEIEFVRNLDFLRIHALQFYSRESVRKIDLCSLI